MGTSVRRVHAAFVAVLMVTSASACAGDDREVGDAVEETDATTTSPAATDVPDRPSAPTSEAPETPEPERTDDQAIIDDYLTSRDAYVAAYNPVDPADPGLLKWFEGNALQRYQNELDDLAAQGHAEIIEYNRYPEVIVNKQGTTAVVSDCYGVEVATIDAASGDQVGEALTYTRHTDFSLERRGDRWVTVNFDHVESECTPGA